MNILSVTNALKEIKLKELDDEFQIGIINALNSVLPDDVKLSYESSGDDIRRAIDSELNVAKRSELMQVRIFTSDKDIVRFFNNVEKVQQAHNQAIQFDDAIKGNFFSVSSFLVIITVLVMVWLYHATENTRGHVPESRVGSVLSMIVSSLATEEDK